MVVKAGSKRRALRPMIATKLDRHRKVAGSTSEALLVRLLRHLLESSRRRKCYPFRYLFHYSPLKFLQNGTFVVASVQRRTVFYCFSALYAVILVYRFQALIGYLTQNGLDVIGVLCAMYVLSMFVGACFYHGVLLSYEDMRQLLNQSHPQFMCQVCGSEEGPFSTLSFLLKRTVFSTMILIAPLNSSLFSLAFDSLPVCVYPILKGIIPDWGISSFMWQIGLFPLEVLSVVPPFIPVIISLVTLLICLTHLKSDVQRLSKMSISNLKDWEQVERDYRRTLVYNQILIVWFKRISTPAVVGAMVSLIGVAYVTVTSYQRLPFVIYVIFPVGFVTAMGMFTLACMDAVNTKMSGNSVMGLLRRRGDFYRSLEMQEKKEFLLRCRTLRPISFPIGNFTDISLNVPIYVFEEVLSQLLFLLSF